MKWRNSKERELLSSGGTRDATLPSKDNPNPDLSDVTENDEPVHPDQQATCGGSTANNQSEMITDRDAISMGDNLAIDDPSENQMAAAAYLMEQMAEGDMESDNSDEEEEEISVS